MIDCYRIKDEIGRLVCNWHKRIYIIDEESIKRSHEAQNWTEAMEKEVILSVILLGMAFLTSASMLFDLQKTDEIEMGDDVEMNKNAKLGNKG